MEQGVVQAICTFIYILCMLLPHVSLLISGDVPLVSAHLKLLKLHWPGRLLIDGE